MERCAPNGAGESLGAALHHPADTVVIMIHCEPLSTSNLPELAHRGTILANRRQPLKPLELRATAMLACLLFSGCSLSAQLPPTQPAGINQQLLIRSLERALAGLDIEMLKGRDVSIDVFVQSGPQPFVKEFVISWLQAHGVRTIAESPEIKWQRNRGQAEVRLYEFERKSVTTVSTPPPGIGRSKYDKLTVLLVLGFTQSDVDKRD